MNAPPRRPAIARTELRHRLLAQADRYRFIPNPARPHAFHNHRDLSWPLPEEVRTLRWLMQRGLINAILGERMYAARRIERTRLGEQTLTEWNNAYGPIEETTP